ncbi:NADH:ubiquinone oxidoreductase [Alkalilacustris brevis]|uniref:NADH:ubiquinone oxidoreductase n=1 Tax=Alkalilacustris brevis TaxID=2026338 RepID=UPI000E0DD56E|nr:NADH:ubiquinone oxidoreductase [Alkalilacustris brevis]
MSNNLESMSCEMKSWLIAAAVGVVAFILMAGLWGWGWFFSALLGLAVAGVLGFLIVQFLCDAAGAAVSAPPEEKPAPTAAPTPQNAQAGAQAAGVQPEEKPAPTATPTPAEGETSAAPATGDHPAGAQPDATQAPAVLDAPRGGAADDLKKIKGLGPKLEEKLNALGIWHYDQIAGWTGAQVAWADEQLGARGRIERDDWVGQARELANEGGA